MRGRNLEDLFRVYLLI